MSSNRSQLLADAAVVLGGQRALAVVLGVGERSVRAWLAGDRGINDGVLRDTEDALVRHGEKCLGLAAALRLEAQST